MNSYYFTIQYLHIDQFVNMLFVLRFEVFKITYPGVMHLVSPKQDVPSGQHVCFMVEQQWYPEGQCNVLSEKSFPQYKDVVATKYIRDSLSRIWNYFYRSYYSEYWIILAWKHV